MRELFVSSFKLICKVFCCSETDLSAGWPALQSRYQSHLFPAFCEIQLFATCPDSFCFCLQASLQRGQSWNCKIRSGAAQVLVASCNAHILFDTPPASISHHTSFCFGQIIEKVILRSGAPFHISIFWRQCLNSFLWILNSFMFCRFELWVKLIWGKSVPLPRCHRHLLRIACFVHCSLLAGAKWVSLL